MRLAKALSEKLNDVRLRDKFIADGKMTKAQADEYMNSLPDDADKAEYISDSSSKDKE